MTKAIIKTTALLIALNLIVFASAKPICKWVIKSSTHKVKVIKP